MTLQTHEDEGHYAKPDAAERRAIRTYLRESGVDYGAKLADMAIEIFGEKLKIDAVQEQLPPLILEHIDQQTEKMREGGLGKPDCKLYRKAMQRGHRARLRWHVERLRKLEQ